jgi:hypothetical protein
MAGGSANRMPRFTKVQSWRKSELSIVGLFLALGRPRVGDSLNNWLCGKHLAACGVGRDRAHRCHFANDRGRAH